MKIMVLGANGYLGRKVILHLKAQKHKVTGVYRKIPPKMKAENIDAITVDIKDISLEVQNNEYDWIVNCAAIYEGRDTAVHEIVDANMIFALQVLNCALEAGVKNFLTIDTSLPRELNLYSFTKKSFSDFGKFYAKKYEINFVNIVLEMFYGEDEPENRFLVRCCKSMIQGEELLLTEGTQKRDIIYIEDVCEAISVILDASLEGFQNVPVGSGEAVPLRTILEYMHEVLASESKLNFGAIPMRANEPDCVADIELLKKCGFVVRYPWKQGIEHLCEKLRVEE